MHTYTISRPKVWTTTLVLLVLSLAIGGGVLLSNYRAWRGTPPAARARNSQKTALLLITSTLALVTILNSLLGFAGPKEMLEVETFRDTLRIHVWAPTVESAILFVLLTSIGFACSNLVTWKCYVMGKAIRGETIPRWKAWLVHSYILLGALNWCLLEVPTQVTIHVKVLDRYRKDLPSFLPGIAWILGSMVLHVCVDTVFIVTFVRSLNGLAQQLGRMDMARIEDLRVLGIKSIVCVANSVLLYFYAMLTFFSHPIQYQINVTSTPYQMGVLLLIYGCFVAKLGVPCGADKHEAGEAAALTAAAAPAPAAADRVLDQADGRRAASVACWENAKKEEEEEVKEAGRSPTSALELGPLAPIQEAAGPAPAVQQDGMPATDSVAGSSGYASSVSTSAGYITQHPSDTGESLGSRPSNEAVYTSSSGSRSSRSRLAGYYSSSGASSSKASSRSSGHLSVASGYGAGENLMAEEAGRGGGRGSPEPRGGRRKRRIRHWRELFSSRDLVWEEDA